MMNKGSRIYIAGHRGMVGSSLLRLLQSQGYSDIITCIHSSLDLTRQEDVERYFKKEQPEYVFLAAARVGGIHANNTYKAEFIYQNIMIAANVIHASFNTGVKKLLNLGSSCIYPKYSEQPMTEDQLLAGPLEPTNEPYAIAKIAALKLCRYYNEQYGTQFISVMPTNLYGPHDNFNLETSHVLPALIRKFHLAKLLGRKDFDSIRLDCAANPLGFNLMTETGSFEDKMIEDSLHSLGITGKRVTVWGSGDVSREFLYSEDLAEACKIVMDSYDYKEIREFINIGTGFDVTIRELAKLIKSVTGYEGEVRFDTSKDEGTPKKLLDVRRINTLGWKAKVMLPEGVRKTYEWYQDSCSGTAF